MVGKRYYWLKWQVGFFQKLIIKQLRTLQCNVTVTEGNTTEISGSTEIENSKREVKGQAIGYCIDKLESLSNSPAEQVAIIKQTIQNGWTDFFPYGKG